MTKRPPASRTLAVARRFWPQVAEHRGQLAVVALLSLAAIAMELLRPWPLRWLLDEGLAPQGTPRYEPVFVVWTGALALVVILLAKTGLEYLGLLRITAAGHAVTRGLRHRIFGHLVELSPAFHAKHKSGDLLMRLMGDAPMLKDMLVTASVTIATRIVLIIGTVIVMFVVDPLLSAVVLLLVPVVVLTIRWLSEHLRIAVRKQRRKEGELADFLHEAIHAAPLIQSLGRSQHTVRRFARSNRQSARAGLKTAKAAARLSASVETLLSVAFAGAVAFGGYRVVTGHLTPGELIVFLSYVRGLLKPVRSASKNQARIAKGTACGERILRVLDETVELRASSGELTPAERPERLAFEAVGYRYPDGTRGLEDVTVEFRSGELCALFGPSGAGKSTLTWLALRIFDPTEGRVLLDDAPLPSYDLDALRERFGLTMQETVLFGESLRENLLLGRPDATEAELWQALTDAGAADFVQDHPEGLDLVLGAGGVGLSGGQARRVCLARSLLRRAPILIADEPFTGLDHAAAAVVAATLARVAEEALVIVVTHAVDRLEVFDRVVFLEGGRVRASGPHAALLDDPAYLAACGAQPDLVRRVR